PLRGEWVLVSTDRNARPWQGRIETAEPQPPQYDAACYLCPGNERTHGARNPHYVSTFAFDNDFPALSRDSGLGMRDAGLDQPNPDPRVPSPGDLLLSRPERGLCRVLCFSPRHDLTLSLMDRRDIRGIVDLWINEYAAAAAVPWVSYAIAF